MLLNPVSVRPFVIILLSVGSLSGLAQPVIAQETVLKPTPERDEWLVLVSPFVWAPSMKGHVELGGVRTKADVGFNDVFHDLDSVFMGNLEVTNRTVGFFVDGVYAKTSQSERVFGRKVGLDITQTTLAIGGYYRAFEYSLDGTTLFNEPRTWRVEPMLGVRWTKLSTTVDIDALGFSTKKKTHWTDPFIGLRTQIDLTDHWTLSGTADTGGFDTSSKKTYNAQAYLGYRLYLMDNPTIVRVGYRVLAQDYRTKDFTGNEFKYDVTQRGPVLGLSMRF
ncbi:hypothetical protein TU78_07055 [Pseudomonas taetrolens]|uniref:Outer membrane protein beta-barrel domain-containing protein n=1 Tax=Pseudomonas taetrolens TaxID=47884 RepID=A0A0J6GKE8_PSETA|nr:hypothetical protein [Pseudomonas taetrolens]KMM85121.1 hypothetical protein TU78_07055 [Pseudomonas taetrolens]